MPSPDALASGPGAALDGLTGEQRRWAEQSERRWQRAHALAAQYPD